MNATFVLKNLLVAVAAVPLLLAGHRADPGYQADNKRISADYQIDKAACAALETHAAQVCFEQARWRKQVARAELESSHDAGSTGDQSSVREAKTSPVNNRRDGSRQPIAVPFKSWVLQ